MPSTGRITALLPEPQAPESRMLLPIRRVSMPRRLIVEDLSPQFIRGSWSVNATDTRARVGERMGGVGGASDAGRLAERRRMAMAVVGEGSGAAARVSSAPDAFVRQLSTSDIARCAKLIDPPPRGTKI